MGLASAEHPEACRVLSEARKPDQAAGRGSAPGESELWTETRRGAVMELADLVGAHELSGCDMESVEDANAI